MEEILVDKGLSGLSRCFRKVIIESNKTGKLLFVGSPFTCLPFAEFLTYSIRDLPIKTYFSPNGDLDKIIEIIAKEGIGYTIGKIEGIKDFEIVVLLGGLAMPKSQVDPILLKEKLEKVSKLDYVIGVCFQGVMNRPEWIDTFKFKYFIDSDISRVSLFKVRKND
ncbi:MAG: DUF2124 family protein [Candidatus Methanomethylicaceae archaeon]